MKQHIRVFIIANMSTQASSAITSVTMSSTCPAIPSALSPVEPSEVSNRMFSCVTTFLGYVAFYTDLMTTASVTCSTNLGKAR